LNAVYFVAFNVIVYKEYTDSLLSYHYYSMVCLSYLLAFMGYFVF